MSDLLQLGLWEPAGDPGAESLSSVALVGSGLEAGEEMGFSCKGQPIRHLRAPGRATLAQPVYEVQLCNGME